MTSWTYAESRPADLSQYVDLLWHFRGASGHPRKRIMPNGKVELLVNLGEPYRAIEKRGLQTVKEGCVSGMLSGPMVLEQPPWQNVLGARLRPVGALALLAAPLRETSGSRRRSRGRFRPSRPRAIRSLPRCRRHSRDVSSSGGLDSPADRREPGRDSRNRLVRRAHRRNTRRCARSGPFAVRRGSRRLGSRAFFERRSG